MDQYVKTIPPGMIVPLTWSIKTNEKTKCRGFLVFKCRPSIPVPPEMAANCPCLLHGQQVTQWFKYCRKMIRKYYKNKEETKRYKRFLLKHYRKPDETTVFAIERCLRDAKNYLAQIKRKIDIVVLSKEDAQRIVKRNRKQIAASAMKKTNVNRLEVLMRAKDGKRIEAEKAKKGQVEKDINGYEYKIVLIGKSETKKWCKIGTRANDEIVLSEIKPSFGHIGYTDSGIKRYGNLNKRKQLKK